MRDGEIWVAVRDVRGCSRRHCTLLTKKYKLKADKPPEVADANRGIPSKSGKRVTLANSVVVVIHSTEDGW